MGGNVTAMGSGGAPISAEVQEFMAVCYGCPFIQGYGLTETGGGTVTHKDDNSSGHIGTPCVNKKVRLKDVPEMGYLTSDDPPRGEICFKGPSLFSGYFKSPDLTKEMFDEDGWFKTGDIGQILPGGRIKIIDRAKNLFKLAQGEYVAPEKLENIYVHLPIVQ